MFRLICPSHAVTLMFTGSQLDIWSETDRVADFKDTLLNWSRRKYNHRTTTTPLLPVRSSLWWWVWIRQGLPREPDQFFGYSRVLGSFLNSLSLSQSNSQTLVLSPIHSGATQPEVYLWQSLFTRQK